MPTSGFALAPFLVLPSCQPGITLVLGHGVRVQRREPRCLLHSVSSLLLGILSAALLVVSLSILGWCSSAVLLVSSLRLLPRRLSLMPESPCSSGLCALVGCRI